MSYTWWGNDPQTKKTIVYIYDMNLTHRIHVWYIYLHLVDFYGKCRYIYHTWMVWVKHVYFLAVIPHSQKNNVELFNDSAGKSGEEPGFINLNPPFMTYVFLHKSWFSGKIGIPQPGQRRFLDDEGIRNTHHLTWFSIDHGRRDTFR